MDISALIKKVSPQEQVELKVLHNAVIQTTKKYKDDPTSARLKDWQAAKSALAEAVDTAQGKLQSEAPDSSAGWKIYQDTATKAEVLRHLQGMGYQVTQRTFYRHCTQGKLHKSTEDLYTKRLVQQYVKDVGLYRPGVVADDPAAMDNLATEKLKKEIKKLDEAGRREELKRKKEENQLIDRQALYLELAARAVTLDTGFRQMIAIEAPTLIVAVQGDVNRQREFEDLLLQVWNTLLNSYATPDEFEVLFEDEECSIQ